MSSCLTEFLPDWWALDWSNATPAQRITALAKLGLAENALEPVMRLAGEAFNRGDLGWSCVWQSATTARAALAELGDLARGFVVLELGVAANAAAELAGERVREPGVGESGFLQSLNANRRMDPDGAPVGWEVLGLETGGTFHSWLCNSLEGDAASRLDIRPGALGLLATQAEADAAGWRVLPRSVGLALDVSVVRRSFRFDLHDLKRRREPTAPTLTNCPNM